MSVLGESHILNLHKPTPTTAKRKSFLIKRLPLVPQVQKTPAKPCGLAAQRPGPGAWLLPASTEERAGGARAGGPRLGGGGSPPSTDLPPTSTARTELPPRHPRRELQRTSTDQPRPCGPRLEMNVQLVGRLQPRPEGPPASPPRGGWGLPSSIPLPELPQVSVSSKGPSQTNAGVPFETKHFQFLARRRRKRGNYRSLRRLIASVDPGCFLGSTASPGKAQATSHLCWALPLCPEASALLGERPPVPTDPREISEALSVGSWKPSQARPHSPAVAMATFWIEGGQKVHLQRAT